MAKIKQPYQCDECGKPREKDANHWWLICLSECGVTGRMNFTSARWSNELAHLDCMKHLCGQSCAQAIFERWLSIGSLDPPSSRPISPNPPSTGKEVPNG